MRILTYYLNGDDGSMFNSAVAAPNPESGDLVVTPETFLRWRLVEYASTCVLRPAIRPQVLRLTKNRDRIAQLLAMTMTSQGTVVFTNGSSSTIFVDQEALDTGKVLP